jgi:YVTN family beta-propeller protein
MPARTRTQRGKLRWRVMPALIAVAGLGLVPAPSASAAAAGGRPAIAYVLNQGGYVTPVNTKTNVDWKPIQVGPDPRAEAATPNGKTLYVTVTGGVVPVSTATRKAGPLIPVAGIPGSITMAPDGKVAYAVSLTSDTVTRINTATDTAGKPIQLGSSPYAVAFTPDSKTAYVADGLSVVPITTATGISGAPIPVTAAQAIAMTPDGKTVYVTGGYYGTVTPISTAADTAGAPIRVGRDPRDIAITPDGKTAYVTSDAPGVVTPISTAANTAGKPVRAGGNHPDAIVFTPDSRTAYVIGGGSGAGTVTPITTATNTAGAPIGTGGDTVAEAITPDGKTVYVVANADNSNPADSQVTPVSTTSNTAGKPIPDPGNPEAIVIAPAQATARTATVTTVYVATYLSHSVTPVNAATGTAGTPIGITGQPLALAATNDGKTLWVASIDNQPAPAQYYLTPIDTVTGRPGTPIHNAGAPMAMSPDGKTLWAAGDGGLLGISTATDAIRAKIPLNGGAHMIVISPDGRRAYVAGVPPYSRKGSVTGINLLTGRIVRTICVPDVTALALTPNGKTVYAAGYDGGGITPISTATITAGPRIYPAGLTFPAMQVSPDGKTLWALAANGFLDRISVATDTPLPAIRIRGYLNTLTVTPKTVYVGQGYAWGRVVPVNAVTGIRGPDIPGARNITAAALSPDGKTLWALGADSQTALPINTVTNQPGWPVAVGEDTEFVVVVRHQT